LCDFVDITWRRLRSSTAGRYSRSFGAVPAAQPAKPSVERSNRSSSWWRPESSGQGLRERVLRTLGVPSPEADPCQRRCRVAFPIGSDTHFGTEVPPVVEALFALTRELSPDLLLYSGLGGARL